MAKRRGQWFGDRAQSAVNDIPLIADVIQLMPPANALESIRDVVFERAIICFAVTRVLNNSVTDVSWMAYHGRVADASVIPLEALNPRSASSTTMAHGNIVQIGRLPVPPVGVTFDSAGAVVNNPITREVMVSEVDFDVKRSIKRGTEGIFLTLACDVQDAIRVDTLWRVYYTYA